MKRSLDVLGPRSEGLGLPTIMDPGLAARWGVPYVHLAVFAIDIDRIRARQEELDEEADARWPFGWEVFLTAIYARDHLDPEAHSELIDDVCVAVIEASEEGERLGAQLPFAVHELVHRKIWPATLDGVFRRWRRRPVALSRQLDALWADEARLAHDLTAACLTAEIDPPLAPPTRAALSRSSP